MCDDRAMTTATSSPELLDPEELDLRRQQALAALDLAIPRAPLSLAYRLGMVLVATMIVLLPFVYLAIVGGAAWGVYWHATENIPEWGVRGSARGKLLGYIGPLVVGAVVVLFMLKPLFAPRAKRPDPVEVDEATEPFLHGFVAALCRAVGAAPPARILIDCQVNASAGFHQGGFGLATRRRDLTIGIPLVESLTLRQFAGVLAHEFGHFGQGFAMRVSFLVMGINAWFARVVYQRDGWDESLVEWSKSNLLSAMVVGNVARFMVWLTRRILWCLMWIARAVSSFMTRQMEFDADAFEIQLAGSRAFRETVHELRLGNTASQLALHRLQAVWEDDKLPDDLPRWHAHHRAAMPDDLRQKVIDGIAEDAGSLFDSHPRDAERVAAAEAAAADGSFAVEGAATLLFDDLDHLRERATASYYSAVLGRQFDREQLVPVASLIDEAQGQDEDSEALERMLGFSLSMRWLPRLPAIECGAIERPQVESLRAAQAEAESVNECTGQLHEAVDALVRVQAAALFVRAKAKLPADRFGLSAASAEAADEAMAAARGALDERVAAADAAAAAAMARLAGSLGSEDESARGEIVALSAIYGPLVDASRALPALHAAVAGCEALIGQIQGQGQPNKHQQRALITARARIRDGVEAVAAALGDAAHPFAAGPKTIRERMLPRIGRDAEIGEVHGVGVAALQGVPELAYRVLARLAALAEAKERALGFDPQPSAHPGEEGDDPDEGLG